MSMQQQNNRTLTEAVDQLYTTFARYPARNNMPACSHCVSQEAIAALTSVPLSSLGSLDLEHYAFKAMTTWGDSEDFRHFLPRLLELAPSEPRDLSLGFERICEKLAYAHWHTWSRKEQLAVLEYLLTYWQALLADFRLRPDQRPYTTPEYMHDLSHLLEDLTPFLRIWEEDQSTSALRSLAEFIHYHCADLSVNGSLTNWRGYRPLEHQLIAWLLEPARRQALEDGYLRSAEELFADELSQAADALFWLQQTNVVQQKVS